jgi:O-antigen ligase
MNKFKLTKADMMKIAILLLLSAVVTILNFSTLGIKDSAMLFAATFVLGAAIYLIFKDKKKSILLFVAAFPILVTARKAFYFDFLVFMVTYETIFVTVLFLSDIKNIFRMVRDSFRNRGGISFNFLLLTLIFAFLSLNSSTYSYDPLLSVRHTYISVIVPIMLMLSVISNFRAADLSKLVYALIVMIDLSCLYGFLQVITNGIGPGGLAANRLKITFGFHNINVFAGIVILILPFIFEKILYGKKTKREWMFLLTSMFISLAALFITYTRGAQLAFLVSMVIIIISRKHKLLMIGFGALALIGAKPVLGKILGRGAANGFASSESTVARIESLFTSLKIMLVYPFGTGAGTFKEMYRRYVSEGYQMIPEDFRRNIVVPGYNLEAAHNLWLQIGTELGIITMIVFFIIVINRLYSGLKYFSYNRAALAAIVAYVIFSVLTGVPFEHKGIITSTLVIWMAFGFIDINNRECSGV